MCETNVTPIEDLRQRALDHYDKASSEVMHHMSVVTDAIKQWNPWRSVDRTPKGDNRVLLVYDTGAVFDTRKQHLMYWRKEEGFPEGITHWKEKPKDPE